MCPKGTFTLGFLWVGGAALLDALTSRIVISESRFPEGNVTQKLSVPGRSSDHPSLGGSARRALPPKDFSGLGRSPASCSPHAQPFWTERTKWVIGAMTDAPYAATEARTCDNRSGRAVPNKHWR